MKILKNIVQDGIEYNKMISKFNEKDKLIGLEPIEEEKVITITLEEYKELLIYKGKYLGYRDKISETTLFADDNPILTKEID